MSEPVHLKNGHGTVSLSACTADGSGYVYTKEDGCPTCGNDLNIFIRESQTHLDCNWVGFAERCVNDGDGCDHRIP